MPNLMYNQAMIIILTGPAGVGKNTIAEAFARKRQKCAVIDVDLVRWMIMQPHNAPWDGEDGKQQQLFGVRNACQLAKNFASQQYDVLIHDVLTNETAKLYRELLHEYTPKVVLLLPTLVEIQKRNASRPPRITGQEINMLYEWQVNLTEYDEKIDNTSLSAEDVAVKLTSIQT